MGIGVSCRAPKLACSRLCDTVIVDNGGCARQAKRAFRAESERFMETGN